MAGNWKRELWLDALARATGEPREPEEWMSYPAIGQLTITRPELLRAFRVYNRRNPERRVRPFNFVSVAYARPFAGVEAPRPVAPYIGSPSVATGAEWVDLRTGKDIRIDPGEFTGALEPGLCSVRTYGEIAREHQMRPEHKFAAPDGGPCLRMTAGQLRRQRIEVLWVEHLGKEGNLLSPAAGGATQPHDLQLLYVDEQEFLDRVLPIIIRLPRTEVAAAAGITERALRSILAQQSQPRSSTRQALVRLALRSLRDVAD